MFKHVPGRLREMHSDSDIAFRRLEDRLQECKSNHTYCNAAPLNEKLPSRVLNVFASDREVALFESNGQKGRYIALSHCWGTSSRLMATKESLEALKSGIAITFLPKTFQDAIKITRRVAVKYL
jgi:Heterokaryon incompatibility protein (HET)